VSGSCRKAALAYAGIGWRVHPYGPSKATIDPAAIRFWWRREPRANVAVATGPGSGVFVVDVDGPEGEASLASLERRYGALPHLYPHQVTGGGRGGWQALFAWPQGREIRNSAGRLGAKLDTRGAGGYVMLPPSATSEPYRWSTDRNPWILPPEPAPAWLVDILDSPEVHEPERPAFSTANHRPSAGEDRYALKALATELKLTARAPEGERNNQLFESAFSLLRLVEAGRLSKAGVLDGLRDAARAAGLDVKETRATLASAAKRRGMRL
jgi:hypothetical protein